MPDGSHQLPLIARWKGHYWSISRSGQLNCFSSGGNAHCSWHSHRPALCPQPSAHLLDIFLPGSSAALLASTHEDMATFSSLILLPMTFLGGTFFSLSQLPLALKMALYLLPLTHCSMCLRAAALGGSFPWWSLMGMAAFLLAFSLASMAVLKRLSV